VEEKIIIRILAVWVAIASSGCSSSKALRPDPSVCLKREPFMVVFRWNGATSKPPPEAAFRTADFVKKFGRTSAGDYPFDRSTFTLYDSEAKCIRSKASSLVTFLRFGRETPSPYLQGYVLEIRCPKATYSCLLSDLMASLKAIDLFRDCVDTDGRNALERVEQLMIRVSERRERRLRLGISPASHLAARNTHDFILHWREVSV